MAILKPPKRNLGPGEAWGRWVETEVKGLQDGTKQQFQAIERSLSGISSSLNSISELVVRRAEQLQTFIWSETLAEEQLGLLQTIVGPSWAKYVTISSALRVDDLSYGGAERVSVFILASNAIATQFPDTSLTTAPYNRTLSGYSGSTGARYESSSQILTLDSTKVVQSQARTMKYDGSSTGSGLFTFANTYIFS